jgi:hypothetical protein
MLLIYGNEEAFSSVGAETFAEILRATDALNQELFESGELVGAYGLADQVNAKMVRVTGGTPVATDGPFAEAKEYLGSFTILDCDSLERALEIAARNPAARYWGPTADRMTPSAGIRRSRVHVAGLRSGILCRDCAPERGRARERLSSTCSHTRAGRLGVGGCAGGGCRRRTR